MEIRHLPYFMSVVRAGSLSRAAIDSKVTQPALSRQMSLLEAEFGERLLVGLALSVSVSVGTSRAE